MKTVGIKTLNALKAKLRELVRMAKSGATILVTERGKVVAELRPARRQPVRASDLDAHFASLAERGELRRRRVDGRWKGPGRVPGLRGISSQVILDELREDER